MDLSLLISVAVGLVIVLLLAKLLVAMLPFALVVVAGIVPLALMVLGLYSCMRSSKQGNTKLLWILIIIVAPVLGPLLWFFWGKRNT